MIATFELIRRISIVSLVAVSLFGCSTAKTLLYQHDGKIYKEYVNGKDSELLAANGEYPAWVPGQKTHFAFVERKKGSTKMKLWVAKADGSSPLALSQFDVHHVFSWSPDGKWIAVGHSKTGTYEIFKLKTDGTAAVQLTSNSVTDLYPAWSPKGDKIAFISSRSGREGLFVIDADGKNEKRLTPVSQRVRNNLDSWPAWSGDGKQIAFVGQWGTQFDLGVVDLQTGKINRITNNGGAHDFTWEDRMLLYFVHNDLYRYDTVSGNTNYLGRFVPQIPHSGLSANASHVFFSYSEPNKPGTKSNPAHIFSVQHYTGAKSDIGVGAWPNVW